MALLSLSYDASAAAYKAVSFKKELLKTMLSNGATDINSPVASAIYFETTKKNPLTYWSELFADELGEDFHFTLCRVHTYESGNYAVKGKKKKAFALNFKKLLRAAKRAIPTRRRL